MIDYLLFISLVVIAYKVGGHPKFSLLLALLVIQIFLGIRYGYGTDYYEYEKIFSEIQRGEDSWGSTELLYKRFIEVLTSFEVFIFTTSLFYVACVGALIYNCVYRNQYLFAILIWLCNPLLFLVQLSSIRQTIALCFFITAVLLVKRNQNLFALAAIVIGGFFHYTLFALFPIIFVLQEFVSKRPFTILMAFLCISLIFLPSEYVGELRELLPLNARSYTESEMSHNISAYFSSFLLFAFIIANYKIVDEKCLIFYKLAMIGILAYVASSVFYMMSRYGLYFEIFTIPLITFYLRSYDSAHRIIAGGVILCFYTFRLYFFFSNPESSLGYATYSTVLFR